MSTPTERAAPAGHPAPAQTPVAPMAPGSVAVGLLIALCALLLLKWLAVVALAAVALVALVWWARRHGIGRRRSSSSASSVHPDPEAIAAGRSVDDCSWCGLAGGHRDGGGRLVRPRHVHPVR